MANEERLSTKLNRVIKERKALGILGVADVPAGVLQSQGFQVFDELKQLVQDERADEQLAGKNPDIKD